MARAAAATQYGQSPLTPESVRASAMQYDSEWNDYISSCTNDIYDDPKLLNRIPSAWPGASINYQQQYSRSASPADHPDEMIFGEFFPSMKTPELEHFYSMSRINDDDFLTKNDDLSSVLITPPWSNDDHVHDPDRVAKRCRHFSSTSAVARPSVATSPSKQSGKLMTGNGGGTSSASTAVARKCLECGTEKSPEWRRGPAGPKTLCNACGLRYAKRLRGAA